MLIYFSLVAIFYRTASPKEESKVGKHFFQLLYLFDYFVAGAWGEHLLRQKNRPAGSMLCADLLLHLSPTPPHSFHLKVAGHPSDAKW